MPDDTESARNQAREDHQRNTQTPTATEQDLRDATLRNAYNAELTWQRQNSGNNN